MLALYRTGRQADALAAFRDARRGLSDELGIEPSTELARLHEAILAHDPSLDPVPQRDTERPTNLPAQTRPLIGRRDERADVLSLLRDGGGRVITLTGKPHFMLRGLTFLAMAFADVEDVKGTERVLVEVDALTGGDSPALDNIRGDCAMSRGDIARAAALYAKSLEWSSRIGETHQAMMDLRSIGMCLGNAGDADAALEVIELIHLHEEHTGRAGNISAAVELLRKARERALEVAGPEAEMQAISRARTVPAQHRIQRVLDLSISLSQEANTAPAPTTGG